MKKWNAAELVELNIAETAHGKWDSIVEISHGDWGTNNDLFDGEDSDGDGIPCTGKGDKGESVTPDIRS